MHSFPPCTQEISNKPSPMLEMSLSCSLSDTMLQHSVSTMVSTWNSFTLFTRGPKLQRASNTTGMRTGQSTIHRPLLNCEVTWQSSFNCFTKTPRRLFLVKATSQVWLCEVLPMWLNLTADWLVSLSAMTSNQPLFTVHSHHLRTVQEETATTEDQKTCFYHPAGASVEAVELIWFQLQEQEQKKGFCFCGKSWKIWTYITCCFHINPFGPRLPAFFPYRETPDRLVAAG